jgi:hypothetical protein
VSVSCRARGHRGNVLRDSNALADEWQGIPPSAWPRVDSCLCRPIFRYRRLRHRDGSSEWDPHANLSGDGTNALSFHSAPRVAVLSAHPGRPPCGAVIIRPHLVLPGSSTRIDPAPLLAVCKSEAARLVNFDRFPTHTVLPSAGTVPDAISNWNE